MKTDIWMPIFIGDYIKDTRHLNTEEHGAYFLIMMELWNKGGKIKKALLPRIALKTQDDFFDIVWPSIEEFFSEDKYGLIEQKRLTKELKASTCRRKVAKTNGKKGGRPITRKEPIGLPKENPKETSSPSSSPSSSSLPKSIKDIYGEFKNVELTEEELQQLKTKYGRDVHGIIEVFSSYVANMKRKPYKSHYAAILQNIDWIIEKVRKRSENESGFTPRKQRACKGAYYSVISGQEEYPPCPIKESCSKFIGNLSCKDDLIYIRPDDPKIYNPSTGKCGWNAK